MENISVVEPIPEKKSHWCFFRWCMGCLWFGTILLVWLIIGGWFLWNHASDFAVEWSGEQPLDMREIVVPEDIEWVEKRLWLLYLALQNTTPWSYVLDQDMIDTILLSGEVQDMVDVELGESDVTISVSIPLEEVEISKIEGRYINAIVRASFLYDRGRTDAYILDIAIPGNTIPSYITDTIYHENLWPNLYRNEDFVEQIQKFETIIMTGGMVLLEIRE